MRAVGAPVPHDMVRQFACLVGRSRFDDCPIGFADCTLAQHLVQPHERFRRFGEQHRSAYGSVDAVYDAQKDIARLGIAYADELLDLVFECRIAFGVGLYQIAAMLIDGYQMVVFVDYVCYREHVTDGM